LSSEGIIAPLNSLPNTTESLPSNLLRPYTGLSLLRTDIGFVE
jgi:hypothetical protein